LLEFLIYLNNYDKIFTISLDLRSISTVFDHHWQSLGRVAIA
jgi:hypothetical protein